MQHLSHRIGRSSQPTGIVRVVPQYAGNCMGAFVAGVGNASPVANTNNPRFNMVALENGEVAFDRTSNDHYMVPLLPRGTLRSYTVAIRFRCSLASYTRLWWVDPWFYGGFRGSYSTAEHISIGVPTSWNAGVHVFQCPAAGNAIWNRTVSLVGTWNADANGGYGRLWLEGRELQNNNGTPHTGDTYSLGGAMRRLAFGGDGNAKVAGFVMLDSAINAGAAQHYSRGKNFWGLFTLPRRTYVEFPSAPTGIPTLSAATVTNITATSATPRVTLTF